MIVDLHDVYGAAVAEDVGIVIVPVDECVELVAVGFVPLPKFLRMN